MSGHVTVEYHAARHPGPWWIACEWPERPFDAWTLCSWDCDACMVVLAAAAETEPWRTSTAVTLDGDEVKSIGKGLAAARAWREEHGLRAI